MNPGKLKAEVIVDSKGAVKEIRKFRKLFPKPRPIKVTLSKNLFDAYGIKAGGLLLILNHEMTFHQLVLMLRNFPFVALNQYPYSKEDPARKFRLVKATTGPARMNMIAVEYVLSFHGDPKYWKWALIAAGLVK